MSKNHVHSLNVSPSHQKYAFSKASRFSYEKPQQDMFELRTDIYYKIDMKPDRRSAIIGYGKRTLGINQDKTLINQPHAYNIPSIFQQHKGFSLKAGRHQIDGPLSHLKHLKSVPSPQNYSIPSTITKNGITLSPKFLDNSDKFIKSVPGPGTYELPSSLQKNGSKIVESQFVSGGGVKIAAEHSVEIRKQKQWNIPGPGQYDLMKYSISNPESLTNSKQGTKFGHEKRHNLAKRGAQKQPGPGAYKIYSEFD